MGFESFEGFTNTEKAEKDSCMCLPRTWVRLCQGPTLPNTGCTHLQRDQAIAKLFSNDLRPIRSPTHSLRRLSFLYTGCHPPMPDELWQPFVLWWVRNDTWWHFDVYFAGPLASFPDVWCIAFVHVSLNCRKFHFQCQLAFHIIFIFYIIYYSHKEYSTYILYIFYIFGCLYILQRSSGTFQTASLSLHIIQFNDF